MDGCVQVVEHLRNSLSPPGYQACTWKANTPESHLERLRSVLATLWFRVVVKDYKDTGVDFTKHLYVPEVDQITHELHHERADHGHLVKRIAGLCPWMYLYKSGVEIIFCNSPCTTFIWHKQIQ